MVFFDILLFALVLLCCVRNGVCCFRKYASKKQNGRYKGVEEGLHQMFKIAMYEKMEEDKRIAKFPCFNIKTVWIFLANVASRKSDIYIHISARSGKSVSGMQISSPM